MLQSKSWCRVASVVLVTLFVAAGGVAEGPGPKGSSDKKGPDQGNPFKALQDAFAKGVTLTAVEPKDLPKEVVDGVARKAPDAKVKKAEKQEIRLTMKYVALDKPQIQRYQAVVVKDDKRVRVQVAPDGKKLGAQPVSETKDAPAKDDKEIEIPAKASKAVKAIKDLYPDAVVKEITTEVYQDPSGTVDVLTYEIEFISKGTKREMVASPEGVIPHLWRPIAEKELPRAVADTLAKEGDKVEKAAQFEVRAGLQFVPLDRPRVVYRLELETDGKLSKLQVRADGIVVAAPVRPGGNRAYLGLALEKDTTTVSEVVKDGPAGMAGVKAGDKVLALGDTKVGSVTDLLKALQALKPGTEAQLHVQRGDKTMALTVKLGTPPG